MREQHRGSVAEALAACGIAVEKKFGKMSARGRLGWPNPMRIARIACK